MQKLKVRDTHQEAKQTISGSIEEAFLKNRRVTIFGAANMMGM
jgi:hypothetical protein